MQKELLFFKKGAEAELVEKIIDGQKVLVKKRIAKGYRNPILDEKIRKLRTRSEKKILREVASSVNVPRVISTDETKGEIVMEYLEGKPLKEVIEKKSVLCEEAGSAIKKLHNLGIIHGDLTTSNIIFIERTKDKELHKRIAKNGPLFFIDFGLGFYSNNVEDKATDLVVFKKTFNATHSTLTGGWEKVIKGYNPDKEVLLRMGQIEKRARYH